MPISLGPFLRRLAAALLVCALAAGLAPAETVWDHEEGWIDLARSPAREAQDLYRYGRGLFLRGDYRAAADVFEAVRRDFPDAPWAEKAELGMALCLGREGRLHEAVARLESLRSAPLRVLTPAVVLDHELDLLDRMKDETPDAAAAAAAGLPEAQMTPAQARRAVWIRGQCLLRLGEYDDARTALERAADDDPSGLFAEALFQAAVADLAACRRGRTEAERMDRAAANLHRFLAHRRDGDVVELAQLYVWTLRTASVEADAARRTEYFAGVALAEDRCAEALPVLRRIAGRRSGSPLGETARLFEAECLMRLAAWSRAFDAYERFLEDYPSSTWFRHAVDREFALSERLTDAGSLARAADALERVIEHLPSGPRAAEAHVRLGNYRLARGDFDEARLNFDAVVSHYAQSPWYYEALFKGGKADLMNSAFRGDNEEVLARARRSFEAYLDRQPRGPYVREAQRLLNDCKDRQADRLMAIARFYERKDRRAAAALYYREVVRDFPGGGAARRAARRLDQFGDEVTSP